jgi:hypothetical protein
VSPHSKRRKRSQASNPQSGISFLTSFRIGTGSSALASRGLSRVTRAAVILLRMNESMTGSATRGLTSAYFSSRIHQGPGHINSMARVHPSLAT